MRHDPHEYAKRGRGPEAQLRSEMAFFAQLWSGKGRIPTFNPDDHPSYNPNKWNRDPILTSTNCYAYACNDPDGHPLGDRPQPGEFAGRAGTGNAGHAVRYAVMWDDQMRHKQ